MSLLNGKTSIYNCDIWGSIILDPLANRIVDTREFQRLDRIRQLGFAYYVYRGAKHTRLEHSIGVYHVTKKIFNNLLGNHRRFEIQFPEEKLSKFGNAESEKIENITKIVSCAGLLHDITHVPFGHSLEDEFAVYDKHDAISSMRLWWCLFDKNSEIRKIVDNNEEFVDGFTNMELFQLIYVILKYKVLITGVQREDFGVKIIKDLKKLTEIDEPEIIKYFEKLSPADTKNLISEIPADLLDFYDMHKKDLWIIKNADDRATTEKCVQLILLYLWYSKVKEEKLFHPFMADVFANTLCADLLDYVRRDARNCGLFLEYNTRIFDHFYIGTDSTSKELKLSMSILDKRGMRRDDIYELIIDLMRCRHILAQSVYYHKTKTLVTTMLIRVLKTLEEDLPKDTNPYHNENSINNFGDDELLRYLELKIREFLERKESKKGKRLEEYGKSELENARDLLLRIRERKLYKVGVILPRVIFEKHQLTPRIRAITEKYHSKTNEKNIEDLENMILEGFQGKVDNVLVYCPPEHPQAKEIATFVQIERNGESIALNQYGSEEKGIVEKEIDLISKGKYENLWKFFVFFPPKTHENKILFAKLVKNCVRTLLNGLDSSHKTEEVCSDPCLITDADSDLLKDRIKNILLEQWFEDTPKELVPPDVKEGIRGEIETLNDENFFLEEDYFKQFWEEWNKIVIKYAPEIEDPLKKNSQKVKEEIIGIVATSALTT